MAPLFISYRAFDDLVDLLREKNKGGETIRVHISPYPWFVSTELRLHMLKDRIASVEPLQVKHILEHYSGVEDVKRLMDYVDLVVFVGKIEDVEVLRSNYGFRTDGAYLVVNP